MSADKYAQFIAEQQKKLSVSGTNAVELTEKKDMSKADIAALKEPKDKFDKKDLEALRNREHLKKEEVEQIDEKERTADELKSKIKKHRLGHHATPETDWPKKKRYLQATSAAERMLAKLPRSKGGESVTKQGIHPVGMTKTQWKNKKWNEEFELDDTMIEENVIELAEAMKKGELGEKSRFHRENAKYHEKMSGKHAVMADKAEQMGDENGFDHHYGEAIHHEMEASRHHNLADRADALRDKVKARKDAKDASERLGKANAARRDMGY